MAGIRIEFAQFGDFDTFDILRSDSPMGIGALPSPLVTGLTTMYYVDTSVVEGSTYYYRVVVWRDGVSQVSDELHVIANSDPYYSYVTSLLHFNGANGSSIFVDEILGNWINVGSPTITTSQSKFGGASGKIDSSASGGGYIKRSATTAYTFSTSEDFTIECWLRIPTSATFISNVVPLVCVGAMNLDSSYGGWNLLLFDTSSATMRLEKDLTNGTAISQSLAYGTALPRDTWIHIEIGRSSGEVYGFIGGVLLGSTSAFSGVDLTNPNSLPVYIGTGNNGIFENNWPLTGFIDDLRVTKGICRNTTAFTPPVYQHPDQ